MLAPVVAAIPTTVTVPAPEVNAKPMVSLAPSCAAVPAASLIVALNNIPVDAPAIPVLGATAAKTTLAAVAPVLTVYEALASPAV